MMGRKTSLIILLIGFVLIGSNPLAGKLDYSAYFPSLLNKSGTWEYSMQMMTPTGKITGKMLIRIDGVEESVDIKLPDGGKHSLDMIKVTSFVSGIPGADKEIRYLRAFKEGIYGTDILDETKQLELDILLPIEIGKVWKSNFKVSEDKKVSLECKVERIGTLEYLGQEGKLQKVEDCLMLTRENKHQDIEITEYYKKDVGLIRGIMNISGIGIEMILEEYEKGKSAKLDMLSIGELGLLARYFKALNLSDLTTLSAMAREPVSFKVDSWEILSVSDEVIKPFKLAEMDAIENELQKKVGVSVGVIQDTRNTLDEAIYAKTNARTSDARKAAQLKEDEMKKVYNELRARHDQLQKDFKLACQEASKEEEIAAFSIWGEHPAIRSYNGEVFSKSLDVQIVTKNGTSQYRFNLRRYLLKNTATDINHRGRYIIINIEKIR
ncbi:hypothetical protein ACFLR7_05280 [Acidobacteriota bacterium]